MSNGSLSREVQWNYKFCEGWLEYKNAKHGVTHYEKIWMMLKANVLYVFSTDTPSTETQIGNLTLDISARFHSNSGSNATKGFKFDLYTGKRVNRFKCYKQSDRELWRGYITGVTKGEIPNNLDLLDSVINKMKDDIRDYKINESTPKDPRIRHGNRFSIASKQDSGVVSMLDESRSSPDNSSQYTLSGGGPTMVHKFYNDKSMDQKSPSWFLSPCSREYAEVVLTKAAELHYGNTLMRESTSHISNGSYVISQRRWNQRNNRFEFDHFEVIRIAEGYKVNVDNPHAPMNCLKDVMDYFFEVSGGSTKPLVTNELKDFQLHEPNYARKIPTRTSLGETLNWPVLDNTDVSNEPQPDYEEPVFSDSHVKQSSNTGPGWRAQSPSILRQPTPSNSGRKTVGWASGDTKASQFHTISGSAADAQSHRRTTQPSFAEWQQRTTAAANIATLDKVINDFENETGFESNAIYANEPEPYNAPHVQASRTVNTSMPVAPPLPKLSFPSQASGASHVRDSQTVNKSIPVVAPSPRFPVVLHPPLALNMRSSEIVNKTIPVAPPPPTSLPVELPATAASTNLRHNVTSMPCHSSSEKSLDIPKDIAIKVKTDDAAGVDTKTPGGVNTLKSKFEPHNDASTSRLTQQRGNSLPVTMSTRSLSSLPGDVKMNNSLPEKTNDDFTNSVHADLVNRSNSINTFCNTNFRQENVQFPSHLNWTKSENRNLKQSSVEGNSRLLRNSTPISATARSACVEQDNTYDDTAVPSNVRMRVESISDPTFKEKLEKLFAGVTVSKHPPNFKRPLPQTPDEPTRLYEVPPMPDGQIQPDDVTYYNENI